MTGSPTHTLAAEGIPLLSSSPHQASYAPSSSGGCVSTASAPASILRCSRSATAAAPGAPSAARRGLSTHRSPRPGGRSPAARIRVASSSVVRQLAGRSLSAQGRYRAGCDPDKQSSACTGRPSPAVVPSSTPVASDNMRSRTASRERVCAATVATRNAPGGKPDLFTSAPPPLPPAAGGGAAVACLSRPCHDMATGRSGSTDAANRPVLHRASSLASTPPGWDSRTCRNPPSRSHRASRLPPLPAAAAQLPHRSLPAPRSCLRSPTPDQPAAVAAWRRGGVLSGPARAAAGGGAATRCAALAMMAARGARRAPPTRPPMERSRGGARSPLLS
mmetsp:Transcript_24481/g.77373  ORF Transcript_24481/g.77373 Transcript_24481/m.77373 type:complete len:333 (+) Transcript_24481:338-1336(+)